MIHDSRRYGVSTESYHRTLGRRGSAGLDEAHEEFE